MIFKVGNEIIDTDTTPVALVFKDKEEAKTVADILANIKDGGLSAFPTEGNGRWWFMLPAGWDMEHDAWATLDEQEKSLLEKSGRVTGNLNFEL